MWRGGASNPAPALAALRVYSNRFTVGLWFRAAQSGSQGFWMRADK
jgi:hypothetical protein